MKWLHYPNGISVLVQYEHLYTILCKPFLISVPVSVNAPLEEEEMLNDEMRDKKHLPINQTSRPA